jgi:hypothetical protein
MHWAAVGRPQLGRWLGSKGWILKFLLEEMEGAQR